MVESIAGAVLIDSKLNLDEVWKVFKPLLSPIVTPDKLERAPSCELTELCDSLGYFMKEIFTATGDGVHAELKLQLENVLLHGQGSGPSSKAAKGMAALQLLRELEVSLYFHYYLDFLLKPRKLFFLTFLWSANSKMYEQEPRERRLMGGYLVY